MPLSNKAHAVLALLRKEGEMTCKAVGEEIYSRTPCGSCEGTGQGDDSRWGCRACYGRGRMLFTYSDAYVALEALRKHGLASRRLIVDEWGDVTNKFVYAAVVVDPADDSLEALFAAPAFGEDG